MRETTTDNTTSMDNIRYEQAKAKQCLKFKSGDPVLVKGRVGHVLSGPTTDHHFIVQFPPDEASSKYSIATVNIDDMI